MDVENKKSYVIIGGLIIGIIAALLSMAGNPANMGFDITGFIRDTVGALGLHQDTGAQYIRPELVGLVWGALILALARGQHKAVGGSSPLVRFVIGFFVTVGALVFMGDPFRMVLRIAGGDWNAIIGLIGFIVGVAVGVYCLKKGFSLKPATAAAKLDSAFAPIVKIVLLILVCAAPAFIVFSDGDGVGAHHAAIIASLIGGLLVGAIAQQTKLCMVGTFRDLFMDRKTTMLCGWIAVLVAAFVVNLLTHQFQGGVDMQPFAHTDGVWNFLGMGLVGWGCTLLGGDPLRQLVLSGEGNTDAAVTVIGMAFGAAISENFALAATVSGPTMNGKVAVIIGLIVVLIISGYYICGKGCSQEQQE
ncbi:YedE-related selenium metabolism membrane protein [Veillonellaceae bacterium M1-70]|nr:YedE-related selenium metabolism membrane protein [Veillonellaceae bacterium M1-70]